jgi:V/A-type H+-transporting ATPase subunit D
MVDQANPTRSNLLFLKEKASAISENIGVLRSRRKALIKEFLDTGLLFIKSRDDIRGLYRKAISELRIAINRDGEDFISAVADSMQERINVDIVERTLWGLRYRDVIYYEDPVRRPDERGYDFLSTSPHLEEGIYCYERIIEAMLNIARYESKLKRLASEITGTTKKIRVLEERVMPALLIKIRAISTYLSERERESYYRLKLFKKKKG